jgi:hypothetical protein
LENNIMNKWRYAVIGGAAVAWAGCADLPSFPDNFGQAGGGASSTNGGSGTVIPTGGTGVTMAGGMSGSTTTVVTGGTGGTGGTGVTTTGGSGVTMTGGTGTGGSDTNMSGSGGMMANPQAEIDDAVKNLKGWRYENPCGYVDGHQLNDGTCNSGEICFPNAQKARFAEKKVIAIGGVAGHQYDVTLRIRGALEPRDYPPDCMRLANSAPDTVGVAENCNGFTNQDTVTFNIFELKIEEPAHVFYLNSVTKHPPHRVDPLDQTFPIRVAGGTKLDFQFDDLNGGEIRNCSITVEGIVPYPKIFDGNFFQLDVVDAKLVP